MLALRCLSLSSRPSSSVQVPTPWPLSTSGHLTSAMMPVLHHRAMLERRERGSTAPGASAQTLPLAAAAPMASG